jgi:hypothetical protein
MHVNGSAKRLAVGADLTGRHILFDLTQRIQERLGDISDRIELRSRARHFNIPLSKVLLRRPYYRVAVGRNALIIISRRWKFAEQSGKFALEIFVIQAQTESQVTLFLQFKRN